MHSTHHNYFDGYGKWVLLVILIQKDKAVIFMIAMNLQHHLNKLIIQKFYRRLIGVNQSEEKVLVLGKFRNDWKEIIALRSQVIKK